MSRRQVHQVLAGFAAGDAISHEALAIQRVCRELGHDSLIFAPGDRIAPGTEALCQPLSNFTPRGPDLVIGHYSITSPATEAFLATSARRVMIYHNITPPEFFDPFDQEVAEQLRAARRGLKRIAASADEVWADSAFNASELVALGITAPRVFPLLFDPADLEVPADPAVLAKFAAPLRNILFVGRIAPNKCIEELIEAFAHYHQHIDRQSRLLIVGSERSAPAYYAMLRMYAAELGLQTVFFERFASPAGLAAYYRLASAFVTCSRHEGYCLPLVEAMYKGLPVLARRTGGTPEAMGTGGVLFDDLSAGELAELLGVTLGDAAFRDAITRSQQERIKEIVNRPVRTELEDRLAPLLA